jgi:AraC family transcriptional regulator
MTPKITDKRQINLVGMDFFGDATERAGGWSQGNAVGQLWDRYSRFFESRKESIKHQVPGGGYEVWVDFEGEKDTRNRYIFVGSEVARIEDLPLEFVAKTLPETRYAVFTMKMTDVKAGGLDTLWKKWLPETGLKTSFDFMIEYHDPQRFKGVDDPDSEVDFMVPVR